MYIFIMGTGQFEKCQARNFGLYGSSKGNWKLELKNKVCCSRKKLSTIVIELLKNAGFEIIGSHINIPTWAGV